MQVVIAVAPGELIDKVTILEIKLERIADSSKLANIQREFETLLGDYQALLALNSTLPTLAMRLKDVNSRIWEIEDNIRDLERAKDFGPAFVETARSVYRTNDERAAIKRQINDVLGSFIVEEKSYSAY